MRDRYLTVPLNKKGEEDYDFGYDHTSNIKQMILKEDEFNELVENKVFGFINDQYDLMIDDYESETIPAAYLKDCLEELKKTKGVFLEAAKLAIQYNTFLALDF